MQSISAAARVPVARKAVSHDAIAPLSVDWASQVQLVSVAFPILHGPSAVQSTHGAKHMVTLLQDRQGTVLLTQSAAGGALTSSGDAPASDRFESTSRSPSLSAGPQAGHATSAT